MSKLNLQIPYPTFIENIIVYFLLRYRKKHYGFAFRKIKLIGGKFAIVEPEDYEKISQDAWQLYDNHYGKYYAVRIEDCKIVFMHRQIMGPFDCAQGRQRLVVDHRNREGLDNRKSNLRLATRSQNNSNSLFYTDYRTISKC